MTLRTQTSLNRFFKTVAAAIVAQMLFFIAGGIQINSVEDLKKVGYAMLTATIVGTILGIDKFLRWDDGRPTTPPDNLPIAE